MPAALAGIELVPLGAAIVAFLLATGAAIFLRYLIAAPLGGISIFGTHPFGFLADAVESLAEYPANWGKAAMGALTGWPQRMLNFDRGLWTYTQAITGNLFTHAQNIVQVTIPRAVDGMMTEVTNLVQAARTDATALLVSTVNGVYDDLHRTVGVIEGWIADAESKASSELASATDTLASEIGSTASSLTADLNATAESLTSTIGSVAEQSHLEIQAVAGMLEGEIGTAREAVEGELTGAVQTLEKLLTDTNLETLATATAATAVVATALEEYLKTCGRDLCGGLGGIARLLPILMGLLSEGALLAFLAAAVTDPDGTSDALIAGGSGLVKTVRDDLVAALGA